MEDQLVQQIEQARRRAGDQARPGMVDAAHALNRFSARERVALLVDEGSFIEYGALAGATTSPEDESWADGLVAGVGLVVGQPVVVASYDPFIREGTQSDRNQRKMARLTYLAMEHRWPFLCFVEGLGARSDDPLPPPPIAVAPRGRYDLYDGLAELNGWAPTVAVVTGHCLDGHAGVAMLADFVVATEVARFGSLGGALRPAADYARSGDIDMLCGDERSAINAARSYLAFYLKDHEASAQPDDNAAAIGDIIPQNRRRPYDMRKVLEAFADKASVLELGASWGRSMLTVLARLNGTTVGIYANQPKSPLAGAIDADAADKASRFIELCDAYEFPIVSFVDNPGYMVGPKAESEGIARHHARPLAALHHRTVPLYSVQIRKAYGLGPYAMSGWGSVRRVPELRLAWPTVESGGMSLEGAAYLVKRKEIHAAANKVDAIAIRDAYAEKMRDSTSGLRAGRSFQFDDIVDPAQTRTRISAMLERTPRSLHRDLSRGKKHAIDLR